VFSVQIPSSCAPFGKLIFKIIVKKHICMCVYVCIYIYMCVYMYVYIPCSGSCHHARARPQVADKGTAPDRGGGVAANKLNKQSRTADEGWSSSLGVGRGANNPSL